MLKSRQYESNDRNQYRYRKIRDYVIQNKSAILKKYNDSLSLIFNRNSKRGSLWVRSNDDQKIYHDIPVIALKRYDRARKLHHSWPFSYGRGPFFDVDCRLPTVQAENFTDDTKINNMGTQQTQHRHGFSNYAIFPHLTVRDNVRFGLKQKGSKRWISSTN